MSTTREGRHKWLSRTSFAHLMEGLRMLLLKAFLLLLLLLVPDGAPVTPPEPCGPLPLAPSAASAADTREDFCLGKKTRGCARA